MSSSHTHCPSWVHGSHACGDRPLSTVLKGLTAHIYHLGIGENITLACEYYFKSVTLVLSDAKSGMQGW